MWLAEIFLSLFCKKFNKFNNKEARMLDSIYHKKYFDIALFKILSFICKVVMPVIA